MNELARHLTDDGSHGGLPFHPACPTCREERLAGALRREPLVSRRAQAGLAAAVLATSAAAPAVGLANPPAVAEEGDVDELEGAADPAAPTPPDSGDATAPGTGWGGAPAEEQPGEIPPGEGDAQDEDAAAFERAPADDDDETSPVPDAPPPAATPPAPPAPAPDADETVEQTRGEGGDRTTKRSERRAKSTGERDPAGQTERVGAPAPRAAPMPPAAPATAQPAEAQPLAAAAPPAPPAEQTPESDPGTPDARSHVVSPGESLWSIARERLGAGATTAEIAREVKRIWDLNADSIGTGDPDLVMAGQKLRLK